MRRGRTKTKIRVRSGSRAKRKSHRQNAVPPIFLQVFILNGFKSRKLEVLILRVLQAPSTQVPMI